MCYSKPKMLLGPCDPLSHFKVKGLNMTVPYVGLLWDGEWGEEGRGQPSFVKNIVAL